jgi:predicted SAM-dependent methyltransferase
MDTIADAIERPAETEQPEVENLAALRVLHVGCGGRNGAAVDPTLHWQFRGMQEVRLDVDERAKPDIVASISSMPQIESGSFDYVWGAHVLEHCYEHDVRAALVEFYRVLRPGGVLCMRMPDLRAACQAIADGREDQFLYQSPGGPVRAIDMIYGMARCVESLGPPMAHRYGFTDRTLRRMLLEAGFSDARVWIEMLDIWAEAKK